MGLQNLGAWYSAQFSTFFLGVGCRFWVLPPLSNSRIIIIIWLYIALNRTPNIDCYWVGAVPNVGFKHLETDLKLRIFIVRGGWGLARNLRILGKNFLNTVDPQSTLLKHGTDLRPECRMCKHIRASS